MRLTFLGTNTLFLQKGPSTLLVDPHFSRPGLLALLRNIKPDRARISSALKTFGIHPLDGVLLTHTHYDHALDAVDTIREAGGVLCGSHSAVNLARGAGLPADQYEGVSPGDAVSLGGFQIRFHPAQHIRFPPPAAWIMPDKGAIPEGMALPVMFWRYACGEVLAIQVDHVLIFGSAACQPGAYAGLDVDTVILGIGGLALKSRAYLDRLYHETVLAAGASRILLSHWDNFFKPTIEGLRPLWLAKQAVQNIKNLAERYGQEADVLPFGQPIDL